MGKTTGISWADATFNPWIGCERVSPACANCYADILASGRMGMPGLWGGDETPRHVTAASTWNVPLKLEREAAKDGKRLRVFCASMADVFEERDDLEEHRVRLFELIVRTPHLDWLLLTKRSEFARDWLHGYYEREGETLWDQAEWVTRDGLGWGVLPNIWVGVSVENQRGTWRADILREIPCPVRFISAEPLLQSLLEPATSRSRQSARTDQSDDVTAEGGPVTRGRAPLDLTGIDWLIVGGESGARADARPMHPQWARELRDAAASVPLPGFEGLRTGIPFHFKQWGSWAPRPRTSGILPGDVCLSEDGERVVAGSDYVCFANESEGEVVRYAGASPKSGGKLLDGVEHCDVPGETHPLFAEFYEFEPAQP